MRLWKLLHQPPLPFSVADQDKCMVSFLRSRRFWCPVLSWGVYTQCTSYISCLVLLFQCLHLPPCISQSRLSWCAIVSNSSNWLLKKIVFMFLAMPLSCHMWDLVPWPGIKPRPPTLWAWGLSHWTTREVPLTVLLNVRFLYVVQAYFVCLLAYFEWEVFIFSLFPYIHLSLACLSGSLYP